MDPNQNHPSERDWTEEEKEEFFSSQDAITLASNGSAEWPWWMQRGIFITSIVPPEQGWPIAYYCQLCRETTFLLSPWAIKPEDRDYWHIGNMCASDVHGFEHNMRLGMKGWHDPIELKPSSLWWAREEKP